MGVTTKRWGPGALRVFRAKVKRFEAAARKSARAAVSLAKQLVPRRSGDLARSIEFVEGRVNGRYYAAIRVGEFYWVFVEYGTVNQDAQPFVRPAVEEGRRTMRQLVEAVKGDIANRGAGSV